MTITADMPFLGVCRITRQGFINALVGRPANQGCIDERDNGEYWQEWRAWGVDPLFGLAMFIKESSAGTAGTSIETLSWGNPRSPTVGAVPVDLVAGRTGTFPAFHSWLDGCAATAGRLASPVWPVGAPYGERTSIREVFDHPSGAVWAPAGDAENDPDSYLASMLSLMNQYCDQDDEWIAPTKAPAPLVYSAYVPINYSHGRGGREPLAAILHVTAGETAAGCLNWFANPAAEVSAHYVLDRNGDIYCAVREWDQAWANGVLNRPNRDILLVDRWVTQGINPNSETLSVEVAGFSSQQPSGNPAYDGYTEAQFTSLAFLLPALASRHDLVLDRTDLFGHKELDSVNRANCPGLSDEEWDRIYSAEAPSTGPYDTPDEAYDATGEQIVWAGAYAGKQHWYGLEPQPVARTVGNRLLAYDGGYAVDAGGWQFDEWEEAAAASGQLTIYGRETAPPVTPAPPDPAPGPIVVGAAWPVNPGDGAIDVAQDVTLEWGSDAPTSDVEFDQSDGVRIFALQAHPSTAYGPLTLAEATTYVWRVRGRDSGNVSDWTEARFATTYPVPDPKPPGEEKPPKPPSTDPYPPVVTPTHAEQPAAVTWANVKSGRTDLAVSEKWRPDGAAGSGDWPDTAQHTDPSYPGRHDPDPTWLDIRKLTRRLSMMPAISEALLRSGMFERVPATEDPCSRDWWAEGASEDWGDDCEKMPEHVTVWASRLCTLGLALGAQPTIWQAFASLGFSEAEGHILSATYHCLRRRCRSLEETDHC